MGAINWGFVAGKTQTYYPWESWEHPYVKNQPPVWFHEVLRSDGTPYRQAEVDLIRRAHREVGESKSVDTEAHRASHGGNILPCLGVAQESCPLLIQSRFK